MSDMNDITYLEIRNDKKDILDFMYLGVIRHTTKYSLEVYKYLNSMPKLYAKENENHKKLILYSVWNENIMNMIKKLLIDIPNSEIEKELYNTIYKIINWIDKKKELYKEQDTHILCMTIKN
jgi:hypothetical protein